MITIGIHFFPGGTVRSELPTTMLADEMEEDPSSIVTLVGVVPGGKLPMGKLAIGMKVFILDG